MYMSHGVSILEEVNKNIFCMCKNINFIFVDMAMFLMFICVCMYVCVCVSVSVCVLISFHRKDFS